MKKYIFGMLFTLSLSAQAGVIGVDGSVHLLNACRDASSRSLRSCTVEESGIKLTFTCSDKVYMYNADSAQPMLGCYNTSAMSIVANAPFIVTGAQTVKTNEDFSVTVSGNSGAISGLKFKFGMTNGLTESLQGATGILSASYNNAFAAANMFKGEIAKTHRGHMTRFMAALSEGIAMLDPKNKEKLAIVDWRVQENARLIVVFGTIMNELLTDYDDVERLKTAINALNSLVSQLRISYGWERGLAGNVSKASSALLQVVRLEVQELAAIKMAIGDSNLAPYASLLKTSGILLAKVNASKSGDMKAQREMYDFVDSWNSQEFQDELKKLMNAGPDVKNLVMPKLTMLLKAIESINDLADADLLIPGAETK